MTAAILTDSRSGGIPLPEKEWPRWCATLADGDRRLKQEEISLNVFGRRLPRTPGQLWERVSAPHNGKGDCPPIHQNRSAK